MKDFENETETSSIEYLPLEKDSSMDDSSMDNSWMDDAWMDDEENCRQNIQPGKSSSTRTLTLITVLLLGIIIVLIVHLEKLHNSTEWFSAKETPVGRWVDGSTLYRICISSHNSDPVELEIADCREIIECSCTARAAGTDVWRTVPWTYAQGNEYGAAEWNGGFYISVTNDNVVITPQLGAALFKTDKMNYVLYYVK